MEPDLTTEEMIQDIAEFELNFIDFPTVVSLARLMLLKKYRDMSYNELVSAYDKVFGDDYAL